MSDKTNAGRNSTEVTDFNLYTSVPPVFITQERLRERARRADENKSTPHLREDGEQLRAHADALEEIERLAARVAELEKDAKALLMALRGQRISLSLMLERYSDGEICRMPVNYLRTQMECIDSALAAARGSKP